MMQLNKTAVLTIACLFLFSCSNTTLKKRNDLTDMGLKGKVKTLKETFKALDYGVAINKGDSFFYSSTFNEKGNMIEQDHYNSYGRLDSKDIYKYDEKGNKIGFVEEGGYDNLRVIASYKYDEKGNMIKVDIDDLIRKINKIVDYKYDQKGNKVEEHRVDLAGFAYNYNLPDRNLINEKVTYEYDEKGNVIEEDIEDLESETIKITYKYDKRGTVIEVKHYFPGGPLDFITTYKYEFNKKGNWIKRTEFVTKDGKTVVPQMITEREIEYY